MDGASAGLLVLNGILAVAGLSAFVCYILTVVKMFQAQDTTWAVVSLVFFCIPLIALIRGMQKRDEWDLRTVTNIWLAAILVVIVCRIAQVAIILPQIAASSR